MRSGTLERLRRALVVATWCYFGFMAYELLEPRPFIPPPARFTLNFIHLLGFFVLGEMVGLARKRWSVVVWGLTLMCWGCGSEYLQRFTGRFFEYGDMAQNTVGIWLGLGAASALRRFLAKRIEVENDGQ